MKTKRKSRDPNGRSATPTTTAPSPKVAAAFRILPVAVAVAVVVLCAIVHGLWTARWGEARDTVSAASQLEQLPATIGDWDAQDLELDARQLRVAEAIGYVYRRYINRRSGAVLSLIIVCGRPGPIAVHPPDVCYTAAGFNPLAAPARHSVPAGASVEQAEFWASTFRRQDASSSEDLRVFWSWSATGVWKAPDNPRLTFARYRTLYKMYVVRQVYSADETTKDSESDDFIRGLLPELSRCVFPTT
jgi:hypothetical protein